MKMAFLPRRGFCLALSLQMLLSATCLAPEVEARQRYSTIQGNIREEAEIEPYAGGKKAGPVHDWELLCKIESDAELKDKVMKQADEGNLDHLFILGCMNLHGKGIEKNIPAAFELFKACANKGHSNSQNNLGFMFEEGIGTKKDLKQAMVWYQKAADYKNANGLCNLANMIEHGRGVPANPEQAYVLYQQASELGSKVARQNVFGYEFERDRKWKLKGIEVSQNTPETTPASKWAKAAPAAKPTLTYNPTTALFRNENNSAAAKTAAPSAPAAKTAAPAAVAAAPPATASVAETPASAEPEAKPETPASLSAGTPTLTAILNRLSKGTSLDQSKAEQPKKTDAKPEQVALKTTESTEKSAEKVAEKVTEKVTDKVAEKAAEKTAPASAESSVKTASAEKSADKSDKPAIATEKTTEVKPTAVAETPKEKLAVAEKPVVEKAATSEKLASVEKQAVAEKPASVEKQSTAEKQKQTLAEKPASADKQTVAEKPAATEPLTASKPAEKPAEQPTQIAALQSSDKPATQKVEEKPVAVVAKKSALDTPVVFPKAPEKPAAVKTAASPAPPGKAEGKPATPATAAKPATTSGADAKLQEFNKLAAKQTNRPIRDKWALIVGITDFQDPNIPDLQYSAKDATDFYNYLVKEANFQPDHVRLLLNEQATQRRVLSELGSKFLARVVKPDDLVVLYFSTHGSPSQLDPRGKNYLVASDSDSADLFATGIEMQKLLDSIQGRVLTDRVLLVMDACHSGFAAPDSKGMSRLGNFKAEDLAQGSGQLVICSSMPEERAWESTRYQNGVFTRKLLEGLRAKGAGTSLVEAFTVARNAVGNEVQEDRPGAKQTPVLKGKWDGNDLVLATPAYAPQTIPSSVAQTLGTDSRVDLIANAPRPQGVRNVSEEKDTEAPTKVSNDSAPRSGVIYLDSQFFSVKGDPKSVAKEYGDAIRTNGTDAELYFVRAKALIQLQDWHNAMTCLSDAIQLSPNRAHYYLGRAYVNFRLGKKVLAEQDLDQARFHDHKLSENIRFHM